MLEKIKDFLKENKKILKMIVPYQAFYLVLVMLFDIYNEIMVRKEIMSAGLFNVDDGGNLGINLISVILYLAPLVWLVVCVALYVKNEDKLMVKLNIDKENSYRIFWLWELLAVVWGVIIYILVCNDLWIVPQYGTVHMNYYNGGEYHLFAIYLLLFSIVLIHLAKVVIIIKSSKNIKSKDVEEQDRAILEAGDMVHKSVKIIGNLILSSFGLIFLLIALLFNNTCAQVPNSSRKIIKEFKKAYNVDLRLHRIVKNTPMEKECIYVHKKNKNYKIRVTQKFGAGDNGLILIPLWNMEEEFYEDIMDDLDKELERELELEKPVVFFSPTYKAKGDVYISLDLYEFRDVDKAVKDIDYIKKCYNDDKNKHLQELSDNIHLSLNIGDYRYDSDIFIYKDTEEIDLMEYNGEIDDYEVKQKIKSQEELREFLQWSFVNGYKDDSDAMITVPKNIKEKYMEQAEEKN